MDHKRRPSPHLTADANSTIMCLNDFLRNRKTETCATPHSGSFPAQARWIHLVEPIKEPRQRFWRDADTCIRYGYLHFSPSLDRIKGHVSVRGGELQRVIQ